MLARSDTTVKRILRVIYTAPGESITITYRNAMSTHSGEICVDGPCSNMSNLHFHGLHVSPNSPQDDVITMMTMPGESLNYVVDVPLDQAPGLYWYHTHPHGESYQQSLDGMSGAIVIEGISRYYPNVAQLPERILVLRDKVLDATPQAEALRKRVEIPEQRCGSASGISARLFTVNGWLRPEIAIAPGERQLLAYCERLARSLCGLRRVDQTRMEVIALDGMPLNFHAPDRRSELLDHVLVKSPAGRESKRS